ncbi:MAG: tRNA uridine-5-carboxymethylaminomethyl(34) synthesis GTPase MnmE [Treponema sp. CETP13]|nr:MAG: tRNA uridine-5-carboxymethylaminomethyl(34) synthesis GTPase MnmE [Treponema sp. CETP13]
MSYTPEEPIAAIATALAPSALAIIRVSGKNCIELISNVFSRPKALNNAKGNTLLYGWILAPADHSIVKTTQTVERARIDEVMLAVYRNPKSFTGEDMVEIFCHGGVSPVKSVYNQLLKNGFREAEKGEYTFRAFLNGKTDLTRAEAVREIIDSKTDFSRGRAADRLSGTLFEQIESLKQQLANTLSHIEVGIEYPEDENAIKDSYDSEELRTIEKKLTELSSSWAAEKLYQEGTRIVLCGRTNAGKSSLFNTLLKQDRAIVSDIHGTTRDWIESWISFDGIPARLFDTAGLRETKDSIEAIGVERTKELAADADLNLYLIDATEGIKNEDKNELEALLKNKNKTPLIVVINKTDIAGTDTSKEIADNLLSSFAKLPTTPILNVPANNTNISITPDTIVFISAKKGTGISKLVATVRQTLTAKIGTSNMKTGLGSERQKRAVDDAITSVNHAIHAPEKGLGGDAVILDLEAAIASLGEITGEVSPDDILGNIFSQFCVGK